MELHLVDVTSATVNILVVDDNPKNILAATDVLQTETENVVSASSGAAALRNLMTDDYAVILLDINMPDMDGFETATYIRQNPKTERTPIIFITAYDEGRKEVLRAYTLGAVDYMVKPYVPSILQSKVRVFVELYRMRLDIIKKKELEQELRMQVDLQNSIMSMNKLEGWQHGSVTASMAGVGPIRERAPQVFVDLQREYVLLLELYLDAIGFSEAPPRKRINAVAALIGGHGGGPRDVIDIHLRAVNEVSKDVTPARERAYATEGRLLALELMGFLVDYYRLFSKIGN